MQKQILIRTSHGEIGFEDLCCKQYMKINHLLNMIETEFNTDMNSHPELKHEILDISNFTKRLPQMISEVI